ncbi:hypothetical protein [Sphaerisporangium flaviroseum]|uniref:hypothetical protein n=1 Tax=Sphaerisporangium flaviroseum TaxID=509199 RepID=UPI003CD056D6
MRTYLRRRGIQAVIPERKDQIANRKRKGSQGGRPHAFDAETYKQPNLVERYFGKLKQWRAIGEVDSGRPADVSTSGFPRAASRTRRARLRAPGSPQVPFWPGQILRPSRCRNYGASSTGSSRTPSRLASRTPTVWQCQSVPTLSGLLTARLGILRDELPSASAGLLRQPDGEGLSPHSTPWRLVAHPPGTTSSPCATKPPPTSGLAPYETDPRDGTRNGEAEKVKGELVEAQQALLKACTAVLGDQPWK